jgi:anti-sigma regulatory factor (Ser/Thr protein kinase)
MDLRALLPCDAASVGRARRLVDDQLAAVADSELVHAAELLVSELVTNAVVHARTAIELRMSFERGVFRAEVTDGSATPPAGRRPTGLAGTGRGLQLVDTLASRWGVVPADGGKTVWFELSTAV